MTTSVAGAGAAAIVLLVVFYGLGFAFTGWQAARRRRAWVDEVRRAQEA